MYLGAVVVWRITRTTQKESVWVFLCETRTTWKDVQWFCVVEHV